MDYTCKCGTKVGTIPRPTSMVIDCLNCGRSESMHEYYQRTGVRKVDLNIGDIGVQYRYSGGQLFNHKGDAVRWMGARPWEGGLMLCVSGKS